eukprot:657231-Pleurochrysis_carterae.AAC.1
MQSLTAQFYASPTRSTQEHGLAFVKTSMRMQRAVNLGGRPTCVTNTLTHALIIRSGSYIEPRLPRRRPCGNEAGGGQASQRRARAGGTGQAGCRLREWRRVEHDGGDGAKSWGGGCCGAAGGGCCGDAGGACCGAAGGGCCGAAGGGCCGDAGGGCCGDAGGG